MENGHFGQRHAEERNGQRSGEHGGQGGKAGGRVLHAEQTEHKNSGENQACGPKDPGAEEQNWGHDFFPSRAAISSASWRRSAGLIIWLSTMPTSSSFTEPPQKRSTSWRAASMAMLRLVSTAR